MPTATRFQITLEDGSTVTLEHREGRSRSAPPRAPVDLGPALVLDATVTPEGCQLRLLALGSMPLEARTVVDESGRTVEEAAQRITLQVLAIARAA